MRLAAVHAWPPFRILAIMRPVTASSMSASSRMRNGALPPSSIAVLRIESDDSRSSVRPTSVEPVNDNARTRESWSMAETT